MSDRERPLDRLAAPSQVIERHDSDQDLALVGIIATMLDPERILDSVDKVLDLVRDATGADSAELFLLDPQANELLLVAHCGDEQDAFFERCRFPVRSGFPGLAVDSGVPVYTSDLQSDERFLRAGVKKEGYCSFISIPIGASRSVIGTLDLAWKRRGVDFSWITRLSTWLGKPLSNALMASASSNSRRWEIDDTEIHQRFLAASEADEVTLISLSSAVGAGEAWSDPHVSCDRVQREGLVVLDSDPASWHERCRDKCGFAEVRCCVPLTHGDQLLGVVRLSYNQDIPTPATRHAVASMALAATYVSELQRSARSLETETEVETTPALELRCFGTFEILVDGEPLPRSSFSRKKALELLRLLVLRSGQRLPGERLIRLLWPGVDPSAGKNRLYGVVHALRNAIEPKPVKQDHVYVVSEEGFYNLNPSPQLRVDLWEFRRLLDRARHADIVKDPPREVAQLLQRAVDLYCGELFADLPDTIWAIDPRSRCREQCVNALLHLRRLQAEIGTPDEALRLLRAAVAIDPQREDVHRLLIGALRDMGRERDAKAQSEALRRQLAK